MQRARQTIRNSFRPTDLGLARERFACRRALDLLPNLSYNNAFIYTQARALSRMMRLTQHLRIGPRFNRQQRCA